MPIPRWVAQINKRVINPRAVRKGARPVITHVGRTSGRTYRTPLDAHPIEGGWAFFPLYGGRTDWLRNVLAAGSARLTVDGTETELANPRMVGWEELRELLPVGTKPPPGWARVREFLRMDVAS